MESAIRTRRSIRRFSSEPVRPGAVNELLLDACTAPAPHHTRPWRFAALFDHGPKDRLARAMGEAWRRDMTADGVDPGLQDRLIQRSYRRVTGAPAVVVACLVSEDLRSWPDARRRASEWAMAQHSLGCAIQNLMLGAHLRGLASYWISAPLFCQEAVREALDLPAEWQAQALVAVGHPAEGAEPPPRPAVDLSRLVLYR
jgi:coenzyme F420-0:L-glutamate ligase/coenzyme F420-1:gamma-L-glutamate ligase